MPMSSTIYRCQFGSMFPVGCDPTLKARVPQSSKTRNPNKSSTLFPWLLAGTNSRRRGFRCLLMLTAIIWRLGFFNIYGLISIWNLSLFHALISPLSAMPR